MPFCPFVSNRTLRSQRAQPPPPPPPSSSTRIISKFTKGSEKKNKPLTVAGSYLKNAGFLQGPPMKLGQEYFFFDPLYPPIFSEGVYGVSLMEYLAERANHKREKEKDIDQNIIVSEKPVVSSKAKLKAPPLPPLNMGNVVSDIKPASNKIVINKTKKDDAPKTEELSGWQAVMAEMAKRAKKKSGGAPEISEVKAPPKEPPKKKEQPKKKKKKTVFKDVVEELNYKMAVKRGEIIEADDDDDDDAPVEQSKPEPSKEIKAPKPDIASMLSKRLTLAAPQSSSKSSTVNSSQTLDPTKYEIAIPMKSQRPAPPPLPKLWPPTPVTDSYPKKVSVPVPKENQENKVTLEKERFDISPQVKVLDPPKWKILPEGYYIGRNQNDEIKPYDIKSSGILTEETRASIIQEYFSISTENEQEDENEDIEPEVPIIYHDLSKEKKIDNKVKKIAIADLPLPTGFYAAVERMKKSNELRKDYLEKEKAMGLRYYGDSFDQYENSPVKPKPKKSTKPQQFLFSTDKHFEEKYLTFRKGVYNEESDEVKNSTFDRLNQISKIQHQVSSDKNAANAFWINSLRASEDRKFMLDEFSKSKLNQSACLQNSMRVISSPKSKLENHFSEDFLMSPDQLPSTYCISTTKSVTKPKSPRLRSEEIVKRKQQERELKEREILRQEKHEKMLKSLKSREYLEKMIQSSSKRNREVSRMIQKYKGNKKLGIDLEKLSEEALLEYHHSQNIDSISFNLPNSNRKEKEPSVLHSMNQKYQWYQHNQLEELSEFPLHAQRSCQSSQSHFFQNFTGYCETNTPTKPMIYEDLVYDEYRD